MDETMLSDADGGALTGASDTADIVDAGAGALITGDGVLIVGDTSVGAAGGAIVTGAGAGALLVSTLCAKTGAEDRTRTAAIAVVPKRSGVWFFFIARLQSSE